MELEKHLLKLELRTAVLEEGAEIKEEQLEDVVHDLKLLITQIATINQWISKQFGHQLMSKNKYIFAEEEEDEVFAVAGDIDQRSPATASLTPPGTQVLDTENLAAGNSNNGDGTEGESVLASSVMNTGQQEEGSFDSIVEDWLNKVHGPVDVGGGAERASQNCQPSLKVPACEVSLVDIAKSTIAEIAAVSNQYKTEAGQLQQQPGPSPNSELQNNRNNISAAEPETVQVQQIPILVRKRFICQYCSRGFTTRHQLTNHIRIHTGEKPFGCSICPQRFSRTDYLKAHMKRRHGGVSHSNTSEHEHEPTHEDQLQLGRETSNHEYHRCNICGLNFENSDGLKAHLSTSHARHKLESSSNSTSTTEPETQYSMPPWRNTSNNGRDGARKNHATVAATTHRGCCRYCGRTCSRSNLKAHERIHTGEKPYRCLICQQRFVRGESLKVHMRVHTGEKRYGCHLCSQAFVLSTSLDGHLNRDHHGVKPYQCQLCEQAFYSKVVRQQHTTRVHQDMHIWRCKVCGISCQTSRGLHIHTSGKHYKKKKKNDHRDMIGTEEVKMEFHGSGSSTPLLGEVDVEEKETLGKTLEQFGEFDT